MQLVNGDPYYGGNHFPPLTEIDQGLLWSYFRLYRITPIDSENRGETLEVICSSGF